MRSTIEKDLKIHRVALRTAGRGKDRRMEEVKVWEEEVVIPTYEPGEPQKNPMFLEGRVYQGSSGKVYPYPVTEDISYEKTDRTYRAVFLENQYL